MWDPDLREADPDACASGTRKVARRLQTPDDAPAAGDPLALPPSERPTAPVAARQGIDRVDQEPDAGPTYARVLTPNGLRKAELERAERVTSPVPALAEASLKDSFKAPPPPRPSPSLRELATFVRVPRRVRTGSLVRAQLDHTQAFVLSLIDGQIDVETICDVSPLPPKEVCRILDVLEREGLIALD